MLKPVESMPEAGWVYSSDQRAGEAEATNARTAAAGGRGGGSQELAWLNEPEDREVEFGGEDNLLRGGRPDARDLESGGTVLGRASDLPISVRRSPDGDSQAAQDRPRKRLHKVWPARNKFFCKGMLMTGGETEMGITPNCSVPNLCAWTCILVPCSLYFCMVFPHLLRQGAVAMPVATLVFLMTTGFLLATCCSDPGIIPRREVILATGCAERLQAALGYDPLLDSKIIPRDGSKPSGGWGKPAIPHELSSRGYRWCRTCRIIRPPRASHCPDCDNCVLRYDHHCPFVNNCVGQRNYHFFFGFVTSVLCLSLLVLPVLFWFLNSDNFELAIDGMLDVSSGALQPLFWALIGFGSLAGLAALLGGVLWTYHAFLIATKRTTKEFQKSIKNIDEEPTLCASRGPRLFDPSSLVDPRDLIRPDEAPAGDPPVFCSVCWGDDY